MPAGVAVVGVANRKGGVGKTTIAVNLAATFAAAGRHVVLLDADPQGSATEWAQQRRWRDRFPVTPAKITTVSNFVGTVEQATGGKTDLVVVDLPPSLAKTSLVVALAANLIVIPITASPLDLWAARAAVESVSDARNLRGGEQPLLSVAPSRIDDRTSRGKRLASGLAAMGFVVGPAMRERVAYRDAAERGRTVADLEKHSPARREYAALAAHVAARLGELDLGARPGATEAPKQAQPSQPLTEAETAH